MPEAAFYSQGLILFAKRFHQHKLKITSGLLCRQLGLLEHRSRTSLWLAFLLGITATPPIPQITPPAIARNKPTRTSHYQVWWRSFYQDNNNNKHQTKNHQETGWGGYFGFKHRQTVNGAPLQLPEYGFFQRNQWNCVWCVHIFPPIIHEVTVLVDALSIGLVPDEDKHMVDPLVYEIRLYEPSGTQRKCRAQHFTHSVLLWACSAL